MAAAPLGLLRCPSCICAFAVWQALLFASEVVYYAQPDQAKALWALGLCGHSALAILVVLMTAIEEDLNDIPCVGARATSAVMAAKATVGKPLWGFFGSQAFVLIISLYLSACSGYLTSKSLAPLSQYLWCSVFTLSTIVHILNIIRIIFSFMYGLLFGLFGRMRPASTSTKED